MFLPDNFCTRMFFFRLFKYISVLLFLPNSKVTAIMFILLLSFHQAITLTPLRDHILIDLLQQPDITIDRRHFPAHEGHGLGFEDLRCLRIFVLQYLLYRFMTVRLEHQRLELHPRLYLGGQVHRQIQNIRDHDQYDFGVLDMCPFQQVVDERLILDKVVNLI